MEKHNLNSLNPAKFAELIKSREVAIAMASDDTPALDFTPNSLAKILHPKTQHLKVQEITQQKNCKTFKLVPDIEEKTQHCAYFTAGQYLSVNVNIDGKIYSRPYSIVSSPKDALQGFYLLTIKAVEGGLVSNFILNNWTKGTAVEVSEPTGGFTFEPLRDAQHIVGVAGGSGITPFVSLAKAVSEGDEDCSLTILYGSRTEEDILFKAELQEISQKCDKIKVVYVLSEQEKEEFEHGFITAELISKYAPKDKYSVFLCGPEQMVHFADKELEKLSLEPKFIRHEVHGEVADPTVFADYPADAPEKVNITVKVKDERTEISASSKNTILRILEQNGITPPNRCRSGECGFCHSRLVAGKVFIPEEFDKRRQADERFGYIHPCCSYPLSDLEIEVSEK